MTATSAGLEPITAAPIEKLSLRSSFAWTLAGNVIYALCQGGILSVLAKLGSASTVGQFALALAISAPVFMFTNLQLRAVQATDSGSEYLFADYFTLRLLATIVGVVAVVALVVVLPLNYATKTVAVLVACARAFECTSDIVAGLLQKEERLDKAAISLMIRGFVSFVVFAVLFACFRSLPEAVLGMVIVWMTVVLLYDIRCASLILGSHDCFFRFDARSLRNLFVLSLPLGVVISFTQVSINIPRYLLQHYRGPAELGVYASLAYLAIVINLVVYALGQSVTTRLASLFAARDLTAFCKLVAKLVAFGLAITAFGVPLAIVVGGKVLTLVYRPEYAQHSTALALLVGAAGASAIASFLTCGVSAARSFRAQVPVTVVSTATVALGCVLFIPHHGLEGAAAAFLLSSLASVIGSMWILLAALSSVAHESNGFITAWVGVAGHGKGLES